LTDLYAAHAAGAQVIGYANKAGKVNLFVAEHPDAVITNITILGQALLLDNRDCE
jgi:phosphoglycolate phosphatase-like HAD superfamily hydrolase